jgi:putative transcriptional regulator
MSDAEQLGNHLRRLRQQFGLTQAQLAEIVGVSRQTINYVENGQYCPSTLLGLRIARALKVRMEDLFYIIEQE